jgi:hypothetical protein
MGLALAWASVDELGLGLMNIYHFPEVSGRGALAVVAAHRHSHRPDLFALYNREGPQGG